MNEKSEALAKPETLLRRNRKIHGMSAILLPFLDCGSVDWRSLQDHVGRTAAAGLVPAVNMDTGYANLLDEATRDRVLKSTQSVLDGQEFVAGAFVGDKPGARFDIDEYQKQIGLIERHGGTPIVFQSYGLAHQGGDEVIESYKKIARSTEKFLAFELGTMFADFGRIYDLDVFEELIQIPQCVGAKHSSLDRELEWQRLQVRNRVRPEFMILTGNDLAIDMVMYGSDYLLGLSTFCPDIFAKRDAMWHVGDPKFFAINDVLQYLGFFAFRNPTSAYKHSAAMFLKLRGWIETNRTHPRSSCRPDSDIDVLRSICDQIGLELPQ